MSFVRTVLGDIEPAALGVCYAHEHIVIDESYVTEKNPEFLLSDVDRIVEELAMFRAAGGRAMVDSMPADCGRNVLKLAEVSRQTGVHILCPTGVHLAKYYPAGHWAQRLNADELAEVFVGEIEQGIDANDLGGPTLRRTNHKAGLIKVAGGQDALDARERKLFIAAATAQRRTGAPILTHTENGTAGLEQIEILKSAGADLAHVVLSHTDRLPDIDYHRQLLRTGVKLEYDSAFRWKTGNPTLDLLVRLLPEFPSQIMLGMDAARNRYWRSFGGGPGLAFLLGEFIPSMESAGISRELIDRIFVVNPAETYSFSMEKRS
jgi:phosphotriesterase-related protein